MSEVSKKTIGNLINDRVIIEKFNSALGMESGNFLASLVEIARDANLSKMDPMAIVGEAFKAATLGLPIQKTLGYAYIVPYKGAPCFVIGYKGLIQLAIRSGFYSTINAGIVYEGEYRSEDKLSGSFNLNGEKISDEVIGYFAHIELKNGFKKSIYSTRDKIDSHAKKYSPSYNTDSSPWRKEFDSMALKTLIKNVLTHYGPLSIEMRQVMENDEPVQQDDKYYSESKRQTISIQAKDSDEGSGERPKPGF
jgi:recombination protein RecT